jgi:radical SAM protein with 4Fe4S-binding SPASM domain
MLAQLKQRCDAEWIRFLPGNNLGYFGKYHELLRGPSAKSTRCGAGCASIAIEADGSVKGCPSLPTQPFAGGNLRVQRLVDIWRKAPALSATCDRNVEDLWGYCRSCQHADACLAGCTWTAFSLFGRAGNNPYCHHRARELRRRGLQERLVPLGDAPGHPFDYGTFDLILEKATGTDPANERLEV